MLSRSSLIPICLGAVLLATSCLPVTRDGERPMSTVGTSTQRNAIVESCMRKIFYANGRHWVFYSDGTDGVYCTSRDGENWSGPTIFRTGVPFGYRFCGPNGLIAEEFYPSYSAFTFPLVISALALKLSNGFLINQGIDLPVVGMLVNVEECLAVLIVLYVLIRYMGYLVHVKAS